MTQNISIELEYYLTCCAAGSPIPLSVTLDCTNSTYFGWNDGSIMANPSGSFQPSTYLWSNGQTTQIITNLVPGTYSVIVTDSNGHTATASCTTTEPTPLAVNFTYTPPNCFGNPGSIVANVTGGVPDYYYNWYSLPDYTFVNSSDTQSSYGGSYYLQVTDSYSSIDTYPILIPPTPITAEMDGTNETYTGANDGTATVTASGGTPGYTYLWNTGATTMTIIGLAPGIYTVTVSDSNGCDLDSSYTVGTAVPKYLSYTTNLANNSRDYIISNYSTDEFDSSTIESICGVGTPGIKIMVVKYVNLLIDPSLSIDIYVDTTSSASFWADIKGWLYLNNYCDIIYDAGLDKWLINDSKNVTYIQLSLD